MIETVGTWTYNLDTDCDSMSRPDGKTLLWGYDFAGRLSTEAAPGETRTRAYDPLTGNLSSITGPGAVALGFTYDGRLLTSVTWSGPLQGSVEFAHNNELLRSLETVDGASPAQMLYDDDGLLTNAGDLAVAHDPQNGLVTGTILRSTTESFGYSPIGELQSYSGEVSGAPILQYTYVRDALGRITQRTEVIQGVTTVYEYGYDLAGRLEQVKQNGVITATYTFDDNGNRLSRTTPGGTETGTYDVQDRLLTYGTFTYTYNNNGDLASKTDTQTNETTTYFYDVFGSLRAVTLPNADTIDYLVDGQNRRVQKRVNGIVERSWLYSDQLRVVAELDAANNVTSRFVYASRPNVPEYMVKGGVTYRLFHDHLGSVRLVVDAATGAVAQRLDYDEFGRVLADSSPGFQPFGFAGGLYDPDTGLVRFGGRDYSASFGRWLAKDRLQQHSAAPNLYEYARTDPVNYLDVDGRIAKSALSKIAKVVLGGAAGLAGFELACAIVAMQRAKSLYDGTGPGFDKRKHCYVACVVNRCLFGLAPDLVKWGAIQYEHVGGSWNEDSQADVDAGVYGIEKSYSFDSCEAICDDYETCED